MSVARKRSLSRILQEEAAGPRLPEGPQSSNGVPQRRDRLPLYQTSAIVTACILLLCWALSLTAPRARSARHAPKPPECVRLDDSTTARILGSQNHVVSHSIATRSKEAQALFNLGLLQAYGFNQLEATLMFQAALRLDPTCARCAWGLAHAAGPMPNRVAGHIGAPYPVFDAASAQDAWEAVQLALRLADAQAGKSDKGSGGRRSRKSRRLGSSSYGRGNSSRSDISSSTSSDDSISQSSIDNSRDRDGTADRNNNSSNGSPGNSSILDWSALVARDRRYIDATALRYRGSVAAVKGGHWLEHEAAYAAAMEALAAEAQPQDADAYALAAEAHMNLSPWDYYTASGQMRPNAAKAEALAIKALALNPEHLLALHLRVHLAEAAAPGRLGRKASGVTVKAGAVTIADTTPLLAAGTAGTGAGGVSGPAAEAGAPEAAGKAGAAAGEAESAPALLAARAEGSSDTLAALDAQHGHLLHMPSHLYVRLGRYADAVAANEHAYAFDVARAKQCVVPYVPEHNVNMLIYAASMACMYHTAERFANTIRELRSQVPDTWMAKGNEWASLPLLWVRYGKWQQVLAMPPPPYDARGPSSTAGPEYARAVYHYARTFALAARAKAAAAVVEGLLGDEGSAVGPAAVQAAEGAISEAEAELSKLQVAVRHIPKEPQTAPGAGLGLYAAEYKKLGAVYVHMAEAALHLLSNRMEAALEALWAAVGLEEVLGYMEPPRLVQPVRQCLGWVLLRSGLMHEAARVYEQDLELQNPDNAWSLLGLKQARPDDIETAKQWEAAAAHAEVLIDSSCPALSQPFVLPNDDL